MSHVNLIPWNAVEGSPYERPSNNAVHRFADVLRRDHRVPTSIRVTRGAAAFATCRGVLCGRAQTSRGYYHGTALRRTYTGQFRRQLSSNPAMLQTLVDPGGKAGASVSVCALSMRQLGSLLSFVLNVHHFTVHRPIHSLDLLAMAACQQFFSVFHRCRGGSSMWAAAEPAPEGPAAIIRGASMSTRGGVAAG